MNENWLEISDDEIDVADIIHQIRARIAQREGSPLTEDPAAVAASLRRELGDEPGTESGDESTFGRRLRLRVQDTDIIPRNYVIDWRIPILGPIHSIVRRLINDEIRRFLFPSLDKQSRFNRQILRLVQELAEENRRLRQEVALLRGDSPFDDAD